METHGNYYPDCCLQNQEQPDLEVEEQAVEDPMPATYIVDGPSSKDSNPVYFLQTLAARIETLLEKISSVDDSNACQHEIIELQQLAGEMGEDHFFSCMQQHVEGMFASKQAAIIVPVGGEPLKMWEPSFWVKQFPDLFPYGDGAYGLTRRKHISFQQWAAMMLTRTELDYSLDLQVPQKCPLETSCRVCLDSDRTPRTSQARWSANTTFRFVLYDCWRRTEIMKKARLHVRKKGFQQNLKLVARTSAEHLREAMSMLGSASSMNQVAADDRVDPALRRALKVGGKI